MNVSYTISWALSLENATASHRECGIEWREGGVGTCSVDDREPRKTRPCPLGTSLSIVGGRPPLGSAGDRRHLLYMVLASLLAQ